MTSLKLTTHFLSYDAILTQKSDLQIYFFIKFIDETLNKRPSQIKAFDIALN